MSSILRNHDWRSAGGAAGGVSRSIRALKWLRTDSLKVWYLAVSIIFAVLSLLSATTSSLGISSLRFDGVISEDTLGDPLAIRSDEWMRNTPMRLGVMRTGTSAFMTPLGSGPEILVGLHQGISARFVFYEGLIAKSGPVLPDSQLFAFLWWLPFYVLAVSVPFILRSLGVVSWIAILAAALVIVSPVMAWWSLVAPSHASGAFACAALLLLSHRLFSAEDRRPRARILGGIAALLGAAVMAARMALSYPPWTIPLGLLLVFPVGVALAFVNAHKIKYFAWALAGFLLSTAGIIGEMILANRETYDAFLSTAYPGNRRAGGGGVGLDYFLGGLFSASELGQGEEIALLNQSETATGFTFLTLVLLMTPWIVRSRPTGLVRPFMLAAASTTLLLTLWALAPWPDWSESIPLLNLAPPIRVSQILGVGALCLFATLLDSLVRFGLPKSSTGTWVALATFVLLMLVGMALKGSHLPDLTLWEAGTISLLISLCMWLMLQPGAGRIGATALVAFSAIGYLAGGPIQIGLGDLRGPTFESTISQLDRVAADGFIVSDDFLVNALTQAGGVPSLSGEQIAPADTWLLLDPEAEQQQAWNRAALIVFQWDGETGVVIEAPQADVILVKIPPCASELRELNVAAIVSSRQLSDGCLNLAGTFSWAGIERYIYEVDDLRARGGSVRSRPV